MSNGDPSVHNDPYLQPVKVLDRAGNADLSHIAPGMIWPTKEEVAAAAAAGMPPPQPKRKTAEARPAVTAATAAAAAAVPRKAGPAVVAAVGGQAMPAALREAPVMQGWDQVNPNHPDPNAAAAAEPAVEHAALISTSAAAAASSAPASEGTTGGQQFESLQLTAEGAGPTAVAAQAAEQAVSLEGQQQEIVARQGAVAAEQVALEKAVGRDAAIGTKHIGFLLIGFSVGLAVMYAGYDKVHVAVEAMNGYPGPSASAVAAARAAHALD